jgi:predicted restriction endonuclease
VDQYTASRNAIVVVALLDAPIEEQERRVEQILLNRKIRDANFRRQVCDAYDNRCAVTKLRIINGGGKAEAQAAHVWPVAAGGPDVVQNGIALSGTAHRDVPRMWPQPGVRRKMDAIELFGE